MTQTQKHDVCSAKHAGILDNGIRRLGENPNKILKLYVNPGMRVMDLGCGPGFFTLELANLVGSNGHVTAIDLQEEMLGIVNQKVKANKLGGIVKLHQCKSNTIGLNDAFDFILAYYVIHEIPDKERLWKEIKDLLKPGAKMLVSEPRVHVNKATINEMKKQITAAGLKFTELKGGLIKRSFLVENEI